VVRATKTLSGGSVFSAGGRPIGGARGFSGTLITDMTGAGGETVVVASTPAGGSWTDSSLPRFPVTKKITCATASTGGTVQINAPAGRIFGRFTDRTSLGVLVFIEQCNSGDQCIAFVSNVAAHPTTMATASSATMAFTVHKTGYYFIPVPAASFSGDTTRPFNLNGVRIRFAQVGATPLVAHLCGVWMTPRRQARVIFDFDDGFLSQYTDAFAIMNSYGLVGSVAVAKATVGQVTGGIDAHNYCSLRQLQEMNRYGWGMIVHGYTPHNSAPLNTPETILADMIDNRNYVRDNFVGNGHRHYVLVAGQTHPSTNDALAACDMLTCRTTAAEGQLEMPDGVDNPYRLFSVGVSQSAGIANLKGRFDQARLHGWTLRFCGHRIVDTVTDAGNELTKAHFEELCAHIAPFVASGEVENVTAADWWARYF